MNDKFKYQLFAIIQVDTELFLGGYNDTFQAVEDAQYKFKEHELFRIVGKDNCILGTRLYDHPKNSIHEPGEIFWRLPKKIKRNRQRRILSIIYKKLGIE